jgi:tetratricopeptide (TPR) repeat protein
MLERFAEAAAVWETLTRTQPQDIAVWNNLGSSLGAAGDTPRAIAALRKACELSPQRPDYWFNLAKALEINLEAEEACLALARVLELTPGDDEARLLRATLLKALGRMDDATRDLRRVLDRNPDSAMAWTLLANLKTVRLDTDDIERIRRLHAKPALEEDARISLGFTYGQVLEANGQYREAFQAYLEANAAKRKRVRWDPDTLTRAVDASMKTFSGPAPQALDPSLGSEVIFLVGMPRSGSTLLEQILSAHPGIEGAGEIGAFGEILAEESKRRGCAIAQWTPSATAEDWARLGADYLERTARWRGVCPTFTDKGLGKWQYLGTARAMLPGARFVHCRRDPVETCFSCFRHEFRDEPYSYDLQELASCWRDCERMMRFWQARYPGLVYDYVYEDLIARPEQEIRRVLDYCGLPFDPAFLDFHQVKRNVLTASAGQVRQPLYRATPVSERFGALLDPLRQALGLPTA